MTDERWPRVKALFQAAVERPANERAAFLAAATGDDAALRREVESLLASNTADVSFLDRLPVASESVLADPLAARPTSMERTLSRPVLAAGLRVGPYEIVAPLGSGGMGEVYKARDTRLGRLVAIKILPTNLADDPSFKDRFKREAKAISSLDHPHICALYDVGDQDGMSFLVMQYLEGETLEARLKKGALPLDQALALAGQVADALEAAHRKGIIHRDLKPGNILVAPDGAKVLDFGIAKIEHRPSLAGASHVATESRLVTAEGSVLGTPQYMSPEQVEGLEADARSDIFAFGIVLYELITGRRPFAGNSQTSLMAAILKEQPRPVRELQPSTPPSLERVVATCLEKDPDKRWQSAREVKHALTWISAESRLKPTAARTVRMWQAVAAAMVVVTLAVAWWPRRPGTAAVASRFEVVLPESVTLYDFVSMSPDGRKLVFSATGQDGLWIRSLDTLEWRRLPGTEGAASPIWSPDSRRLAFAVGNQIRKVDIEGGPPEVVCSVPVYANGSGTWNDDGVILFGSFGGGSGGPLWKVPQAGGKATAVTDVDITRGELYHTWPTFLQDGKRFIYFRSGPPDVEGLYVGSLDVKPAEQSRQRIMAGDVAASYANGYLFFVRTDTLMARALDVGTLQLKDEPIPIAEHIERTWFNTGVFSVSPSGSLAYFPPAVSGSIQLTWVDRQGKVGGTVGQPNTDGFVDLSPDGTRAVVHDTPYGVPGDLWTVDFPSGRRVRLTFRKDVYSPGVWSPDGSRIAFAAGTFGDTVYEKASSGGGEERQLFKEPGTRHYVTSWSRDGRFLLGHTENTPRTGYDLWVLPLKGDRTPIRLLGETFNEWAGQFSPDMRWIAYASTETGEADVFVRPFRVSAQSGLPELGDGKWQVSREAGNWPRWRNEREILFSDAPTGTAIFAASVRTAGKAFATDIPQRLFAARRASWDVTPDGRRFLLAAAQGQRTAQAPITVVVNWPALLKK